MIRLTHGLNQPSKLSLPIVYEEPGRKVGLAFAACGALFGGLPILLYLLNAYDQKPNPLFLLPFAAVGGMVCNLGLSLFFSRLSLVISESTVSLRRATLSSREEWEELKTAFAGILGVENEVADSRDGTLNKEHVILLKHGRDENRTIELSRSSESCFDADIKGYAEALKFPSLGQSQPKSALSREAARGLNRAYAICVVVAVAFCLAAAYHAERALYESGRKIVSLTIREGIITAQPFAQVPRAPIQPTVGPVSLSPNMNPLRATIYFTCSPSNTPILVDYSIRLRSIRGSTVWETHRGFPVGSRDQQYNQSFSLGIFSVPEPDSYIFDVSFAGRNVDDISSMSLALRANASEVSRPFIVGCLAGAALFGLTCFFLKVQFYRKQDG